MRGLFLLAATALFATGCGPPIGSYCDQVCECIECSRSERRACGTDVGTSQKQAANLECSEPFDAYLACAADGITCTDATTSVASCETEADALYACAGDIGVGKTACEAAVEAFAEKYASCGVELPEGTGQLPSCVEFQQVQLACRAACVEKASCDAITGADGAASVALNNCIDACQ